MNKRSKIILIGVLSVILGVVSLLTGRSLYKPVVPAQGAGETPVPTVVAYDPTKAEGTEENPFTILEIVPNYSYAQIGYLIDGQEPVQVYGAGGILENARAGYEGAYEFLELLSEFTVSGTKGTQSGSGEGTGVDNSNTIYAFDDEKSKYPAEYTWTQSADKIDRVIEYYTEASSAQIADNTLVKYELVKQEITNGNESGYSRIIYRSTPRLSSFRTKNSDEAGEYSRHQIGYYSSEHRFATGQSGTNMQRYSRVEKTSMGMMGSSYTYYEYSRDDSGEFIYYSNYMYYENAGGTHVGEYKEYDLYYMKSAGTSPFNTSKTYYICNGSLGFEENSGYFGGTYNVGSVIEIADEGVTVDTVTIGQEYFYSYTLVEPEEGETEYLFKDEQVDGVEYDKKGTTERVGSFYLADTEVRNDSTIQKYETTIQPDTVTPGASWMELGRYSYVLSKFIPYTDEVGVQRYEKVSGFVKAVDKSDNGSNNSRYEQITVAADKITGSPEGTPKDWETYTFVAEKEVFTDNIPAGYTGMTYDYDFYYKSAASFDGSKFTIPYGTNQNDLYFVTFYYSDSGSGKAYSVVDEYRKSNGNDNSNRYFYKRSGFNGNYTYTIIDEDDYDGSSRSSGNYVVTFEENNTSGTYYVSSAVKYKKDNGYAITNQSINTIASMLYTKQIDPTTYVEAGSSGQFIKKTIPAHYEYDESGNGDYIYYDERLYTKNDAGEYVLYEPATGQSDEDKGNYWVFKDEYYRKNDAGDYVAEYKFVNDASGDYIEWLRDVTQSYVQNNSGKTFYYWIGLSYADNLKYYSDTTYRDQVRDDAEWNLVTEKTEDYFAKRPDPVPTGTPTPTPAELPSANITITHSNVFLKSVLNFGYRDNDPNKALDIDQFEFAGWYTEPECINKYDFDTEVLRANITLYAKWIPKVDGGATFVSDQYKETYTVKFYTKAGAATESYIVENFNSTLPLSKVTYVPEYEKAVGDKKDYIFLGWSLTENGDLLDDDDITQAVGIAATDNVVKLYPVWKVLEVADGKVTDVTDSSAPVEVTETKTVEFKVTKGAETEVVETLEVYENGYIKPEEGGEGEEITDKYLASMESYKPGNQAGKTFVGWYAKENPVLAEDVPYDFSAPVTKDVTLYACWVENGDLNTAEYVISFEDNVDSVKHLLLDEANQKEELPYKELKFAAFKDGALDTVKPSAGIRIPSLIGNVQYKASQYKVEVKTVLSSELNYLYNANKLDELLNKADMIVVNNSKNLPDGYDDIFDKYANKKGGSNKYSATNDLKYEVAVAIFKKSMEVGSAPVLLDKTLLDYRASTTTAKLNVYKLFVMLQSMDAGMFYDSFLKLNATQNVSTSDLWTRIDADGVYGTSEPWYCEKFINALNLSADEKIYYGIDKNQNFNSGAGYPTSLTNHCYVYSGEMFKTGEEFTKNVIAKDEFYTANLFSYFNGKKAAVDNKYAPADAVNYMVFGYQPEIGLDETTAILELQPEYTFKNFKYWYLFVKKYIPNYSGKLIVDCKNTQKTIYLGNAVNDNCETLTVRQMSTLEFVGVISDLNSDYRMIYIGGDLSRDNAAEMQIGGNYYAYLHTGNLKTNLNEKVLGILGGDTDDVDEACYPGNDITAVKRNELYDYCAVAKTPIIIDNSLFSDVANSKINTNLMDSSSNLYQLFANDTNGLLGTAPCYAEGNVDYDTMNALMNEDRVRLLVSSVPPTYKEGQPDKDNYLNPLNQESRILEYKFVLQGKKDTEYKVRLYIDMNADGQFNRATEMLDSLVIRTGSTVLSNRATLEAGKEYTVQRSISDYVGVMPWKLEVYEVGNESVRHSVTGMTAIKPVKKNTEGTSYKKEKLNILQVTSKASGGGMSGLGANNAYMPTTEEMLALDALGDTYTGKKYSQLSSTQKTTLTNYIFNNTEFKNSTSNIQVAYDFWVYLSTLKDFDISITRVSLDELAGGIASGHLNGADFKMDNFNMLIMGFADCYNEITDEASLVAVEDFIESGKSVLFTHDVSSFLNYSSGRVSKSSSLGSVHYWGYNINKRFRNMLGMDRYGATLMYGDEEITTETINSGWSTSTIELHTTKLVGTLNSTGFIADDEEIAQMMAKKDVLYKYNTDQENLWMASENTAYVQGYSRVLLLSSSNGVENNPTTKVSNVNAGQITRYPYTIPDNFTVANTHSQYYQLDLEANDIVVWYCLANDSGVFNQFYNDARNNYYIYSKGNIMYTGVGHSGGLSENEIKLFINTMVAAYAASADPTAPKIINYDRTTGVDEIDYVYVDYDTTFPELAIGEGVDGDKDVEGKPLPNNQTKEINFKLTENSIVTNKLMTVYVYEYISKNADGSINYEPLPMEMEVQKYNSDNTTAPVEGIPVFVVNTDLTNEVNAEYTYRKGQVLSIESNVMVQGGSIDGTSVTIGGTTYNVTLNGNGYYFDKNGDGVWDPGDDAITYKALTDLGDKETPQYSETEEISGYIYIAPIVDAGEEYVFKAPIEGLVDNEMVPYMLHVNLRYGKRQDKEKDGFKELSIVRRALFNLD